MQTRHAAGLSVIAILLSSCVGASAPGRTEVANAGSPQRCEALGKSLAVKWPLSDTRVATAVYHEAGVAPSPPGPPGMAFPPVQLPAHCELTGVMQERKGVDGQDYAIRFHLRLPDQWNGRFFMQGGGGTNGELGDAVGRLQGGADPALAQGYAVLSQDSGHDNARNSVAERNGASAFGFDPQARADYGGDSLEKTASAAKAAIGSYYGAKPRYSYFVGCSKGGQEGMALAQQYPDLFDGIVAGAPGFSLPRAAIAEAWNTQAFASVAKERGEPVTIVSIARSFSMADLQLVSQTVAGVCDANDGMADGIVGDFRKCTSARVVPALKARQCKAGKQDGCLSAGQIAALEQVHGGARSSDGKQIYPGFPWDAGWGDMGWRIWMAGMPDGSSPAINIAMGMPSLASVFSTPPRALGASPEAYLAYALNYDFDRDPAGIDLVQSPFARSAWQDISARSSNLDGFRARGGKLIVPHGVSDPVFSVNDTLAWWEEANARYSGSAASFARVFPVPGMGHCQGGPATDQFDAFGAVVRWVEQGEAPDRIEARAGPMSPWPGKQGVLCPYPMVARPVGDRGKDGGAAAMECRL
ncbi:tannase/feruloyl esterase family alpha/beta hydrolase [Altererythrobacter sp. CC-YST694]|uniref:tannase/feruloyl esterase family alpha/beta hydrolase n=1 Tax=Altererythrobacter sp. CC-YST694 TaxID=2755038 RepID=UPI001D030C28|nr:tannase/feruloyl esterase family alpha/beta hydrolase [Altererythrobacter sp. CC-YST694]MCB5425988.1 tannase/feruloyl esterase family alpha/beta hydrolase [Altererythrobacter sp. CC-YST694]